MEILGVVTSKAMEVAAWLNTIGVTGIVLKYRVPRRPDQPSGCPHRGLCSMRNVRSA
jgi:hypothetical protein